MKHSRRQFIQSTLGFPLAAYLGGPFAFGGQTPSNLVPLLPGAEEELFENPQIVRYDANCFTIHDQDAFVYSAAFHYCRCPQELWRDRLQKLKLAGYNTIETYIIWNYHEPVEGQADLSQLEAFLQLGQSMGFWVIARPGPYVCAEWEAGGFPRWVIIKRFPLRSDAPESIRTSQHWFNLVLPVIQRHQVTLGGPIIMMQVENEYDYWSSLPDADKREYIRALAHMAWNAGIDVPLITCWTKQARENSDPDMARIMDSCNFYPRWNILKEVVPALAKLRREEPQSPMAVTELQGGWFSQFGGKLSVDQDGVDGAQYNMLAKTAIEQGVTYFSTYMGFGGTNFDRAGKGITTTYDYAAPVREPGGLWEKYFAARGIGLTLGLVGGTLARAKASTGVVQSSQPSVSVSERESGTSGVVFVRENANAEQRYKMTFVDPHSPTRRPISAPREGQLTLAPRAMKMLPVQIEIPGGRLCYTTAEVLGFGENLDLQYLIVYDDPERLVEISLLTKDEPHVEGDTVYQYYDPEFESVVLGLRVEAAEKILMLNNHLLIIVLPRERALRTWIAEFSARVVPISRENKPMSVPIMTDAAQLGDHGEIKNGITADLAYRPGEHDLTLLLPPLPARCRVDDAPTDFQYDRHWRTTRVHVTTPACPFQPITLNDVSYWVETSSQPESVAVSTTARPLEELGDVPYGYVRYVASPVHPAEGDKVFISTFADDAKKVFWNGQLVADASNEKKQVDFAPAPSAAGGDNTLEVYYELFGSPNFGENIGELKGIERARVGAEAATAPPIASWQLQRFPAAMRGREIDPQFSIGGWQTASLSGGGAATKELQPAMCWCRTEFQLPEPVEEWWIPLKLDFEADRDALLYLNGKFVGRYVTVGPQKEFFLPETYLVTGEKPKNALTFVLAYAREPFHIQTLRIGAYEEFVTRRTRIELEW